MTRAEAEEFTQALAQVVAGGYRLSLQAWKLGIPQALEMTHQQWVTTYLGGYVRLGVPERREAVVELTEEGMSSFEIADVVGIHPTTVRKDRRAVAKATAHPLADQASSDIERAGATAADIEAAETEAVNEGRIREEREVRPILSRAVRASLDGAQRVRAYGIHSSTLEEIDEQLAQLKKARTALNELIAAYTEARNETRIREGGE